MSQVGPCSSRGVLGASPLEAGHPPGPLRAGLWRPELEEPRRRGARASLEELGVGGRAELELSSFRVGVSRA